ncbi:MAG: hypothetical protein GVY16_02305 [Planctomycetes bacterium]|jgi:hypothetical protein|nr:hypothetical protein [Phycisphaerae bacterium]NBB94550.1 hypothetical protein [Planctomycetota bacterium]
MAELKVVAHYQDGRIVKGLTNNFSLNDPTLLIAPADEEGLPADGQATAVPLADLKAAFLVENLQGNPDRQDIKRFDETDVPTVYGRKLTITFKDGETICGVCPSWRPDLPAFLLTPADLDGNNRRMIVLSKAVQSVQPD